MAVIDISVIKEASEHSEGCLQTVENKYDEDYKTNNIEYWYNHKRIAEDIKSGVYKHISLVDNKVVGTLVELSVKKSE